MGISQMQDFVFNRVKGLSNAPMSYDKPDEVEFLECKACGSEDGHTCECGAEMTEDECEEFGGYCGDTCGAKYNK